MPRRHERGRPSSASVPLADGAGREMLAQAVAHHGAGRLADAEALYRRVLDLDPRDPDALHLLGLAAHQRGDHARARSLVRQALARNARNAAYHNTLGTVALAEGHASEAAAGFRRALALAPGHAEALNNLGNALQALGRMEDAIAAYERALKARPAYAEAHFNLGRAQHALGRTAAAAASYRRAAAGREGYAKALKALGDASAELGRSEDAEDAFRAALAAAPEDAETLAALAAHRERTGSLESALTTAEAALGRDPGNVRAAVVAAKCERRLGRPEDALRRIETLDLSGLDDDAAAFAAFETATILDRLGAYDRAYDAYAEGNRRTNAGPQARAIDKGAFPKEVARLYKRFTADWVASWTQPVAAEQREPVFLIGFPRSGTTLLDQMLDAHPGLQTLDERPALDAAKAAVKKHAEGYPAALARLTAPEIEALREAYFAEAARHGYAPEKGVLVDKMPLNTIDAGLIHRLFPRARILLALRHPCDVVLSGFMQAFKPNEAMIHFGSLADTARFYANVMGLWQRYAEVLPLAFLATRYEDLVADVEGEARRILDFLGQPWDDRVLAYAEHARSRAIATPSYHQVVQPIYARYVGRWRNYEAHLVPAIPVLRPFIDAFGYSVAPDPDSRLSES